MKTILKSRQNGFAIIEALIAFLLLGIGVAALVYLQGNLMSGSATSKARAEAMEMAKDRTEELRNYIDKDLYLSALGDLSDESETGVNATYTVSYTILQKDSAGDLSEIHTTDNPLTIDKTQNLTVTINWPGSEVNSDSTPKIEEVSLETMLYFMSPVIVSATGSGEGGEGGGFSPLMSPLISGVEKRDDSTDLDNKDIISTRSWEDVHRVMTVDTDSNIDFEDVTVKVNTYTTPENGRSNVEVVRIEEDGTVTVMLTSFGGIVHKIEGDIIVDPGATSTLSDLAKPGSTLLGLFASPPSYCLFSICEEVNDYDTTTDVCEKFNRNSTELAEFTSYVCYVPGDCTNGSVDSTGAYDLRCPDPTDINTLPFEPPPGLDDLNGGWYGRVGNFNVELPQDMVCTADTDYPDVLTPSREFATHRWEECDTSVPSVCPKSPFIAGNEGFNRSAIFQTFIIATKDNDADACLELAKNYDAYKRDVNCDLVGTPPAVMGTLMLPPANIIRWVGEIPAIPINQGEADPDILDNIVLPNTLTNVVLPTYTKYCGFVP